MQHFKPAQSRFLGLTIAKNSLEEKLCKNMLQPMPGWSDASSDSQSAEVLTNQL